MPCPVKRFIAKTTRGSKAMNKEETMNKIIDKAYALICDELAKAGIKHDPSDGCIFADDDEKKKTFCIDLGYHECAEYEGE